jgi:stage II sporulation protein M
MAVVALAPSEKLALLSYVKSFFQSLEPGKALNRDLILYSSLFSSMKALFFLWFLGLTIVGLPVIYGFVFARGFVLGFTVGFFASEAGLSGAVFSVLSILPHNILFVPAYLLLGGIAASFSLHLARGRVWRNAGIGRFIVSYTVLCLAMGLVFVLASLIEAYVSQSIMRSASSLIK